LNRPQNGDTPAAWSVCRDFQIGERVMILPRPAFAVAPLLALLVVPVASASIIEVGGSAVIATPPADIRLDLWEHATETRVWTERTVTLGADLDLNAINSGTLQNAADAVPGIAAAGMTVSSYMIRADPIASAQSAFQGFVVFDEPIVGIIYLRTFLISSDDVVGVTGTVYNSNSQRGIEFADDLLTVSSDRRRIDFQFATGGWTDDIRIVTAIPAPGAAAVLTLGAVGAMRRRRFVS
jgi:hypothetical protein